MLFASLGFEAVATTSSGHAATLGRLDGGVTRDEALEHTRPRWRPSTSRSAATSRTASPTSPPRVAANVELTVATGLAGCSIEDFSRRADVEPIYELGLATDRVSRRGRRARTRGRVHFVIAARARTTCTAGPISPDTIAPAPARTRKPAPTCSTRRATSPPTSRRIVAAVDRPVNVLALPGAPPVAELRRARSRPGIGRRDVGRRGNERGRLPHPRSRRLRNLRLVPRPPGRVGPGERASCYAASTLKPCAETSLSSEACNPPRRGRRSRPLPSSTSARCRASPARTPLIAGAFDDAAAEVAAVTERLLRSLPDRRQPPKTVPPLRRPEVRARLGLSESIG